MIPHLSFSSKKLAYSKVIGKPEQRFLYTKRKFKKKKKTNTKKPSQNNNLLINLLLSVINRNEGQNEEQDSDIQLTRTSI